MSRSNAGWQTPGSAPEAVPPEAFRRVMSHLAGGVTIVTSTLESQPVGMTATAVCSVSARPPMVLASLASGTRTALGIQENGTFAVHLLPLGSQHLAEQFASAGDHFAGISFRPERLTGVPILDGALGHCACVVERSVVAADHVLFIGKVVASDLASDETEPLVYFSRSYRGLSAASEAQPGSLEPWGSIEEVGIPGWGLPL